MSNFKMVFKMYREIARLDKQIEPVAFSNALITATRPFVNIYYTAKIIALLTNGANFKNLIAYICIAVLLNFVFMYAGTFTDDHYQVKANMLFDKENFKMAKRFSIQNMKLLRTVILEILFISTRKQEQVAGQGSHIICGQARCL